MVRPDPVFGSRRLSEQFHAAFPDNQSEKGPENEGNRTNKDDEPKKASDSGTHSGHASVSVSNKTRDQSSAQDIKQPTEEKIFEYFTPIHSLLRNVA